ncbi:hypothetical protein B0J14DRAFT_361336 [Halenospora varia]|nr:hypothetical protein B0J14DRAFT_361336 [Halenospora varia]
MVRNSCKLRAVLSALSQLAVRGLIPVFQDPGNLSFNQTFSLARSRSGLFHANWRVLVASRKLPKEGISRASAR